MRNLLILCYCTMLSFYAHAYDEDLKNIEIKPGQKHFSISLKANLTTGYVWVIKQYNTSYLRLIGSKYIPDKPSLIGSGGHMQFNFAIKPKITLPQRTDIKFVYTRPWMHNTGTFKTIVVDLH